MRPFGRTRPIRTSPRNRRWRMRPSRARGALKCRALSSGKTKRTMDLTTLSISQIRELLKSRQASAVEIAQAHLGQINEKDKDVCAYLSLCPELALAQAKKVDA